MADGHNDLGMICKICKNMFDGNDYLGMICKICKNLFDGNDYLGMICKICKNMFDGNNYLGMIVTELLLWASQSASDITSTWNIIGLSSKLSQPIMTEYQDVDKGHLDLPQDVRDIFRTRLERAPAFWHKWRQSLRLKNVKICYLICQRAF